VREIITIPAGAPRERWVELLELADEAVPLRAYLHDGELFGCRDPNSDEPLAAILVIDLGGGRAELRAVAVAESAQGRGVGAWIVHAVFERLRAGGMHTAVVGTASSGVRQLAFYQRLGFRLTRIERDYFRVDKGYPPDLSENGIPIRDMVWMDRLL
jgi:ribosomal protein S18 acetylase RimI-like enzyme